MLQLILVELKKQRISMIGWGLGLAAYAAMTLSVAPDLVSQLSAFKLDKMPLYQAFGINRPIDSATGLLAVYFPFFGLMLAIYAVIAGAGTLAGEEDNGTLELLLTMPLPRWQIVLSKTIALSLALFLAALIGASGFALLYPSVHEKIDIDLARLVMAMLDGWPLAFMLAMFTLLLGSYLPHRNHALGGGLALLIGSYLYNNLGATVESLKGTLGWQPFYYYQAGKLLTEKYNWSYTSLLVGMGLLCLGLAMVAFQRRNIMVGEWPWQKFGRISA